MKIIWKVRVADSPCCGTIGTTIDHQMIFISPIYNRTLVSGPISNSNTLKTGIDYSTICTPGQTRWV